MVKEIKLKPIGFAKTSQKPQIGGFKKVVTDLVLKKDYQEALLGLMGYSHLVVIYWMHKIQTCDLRHVPQGKVGEVPEVGIFACRCPERPNPIGISTVKILKVEGNTVRVEGLDVISQTPILDIKPYTPQYDAAQNAKYPSWVNRLEY